MEKRAIAFALAIVDLGLSYLSFTDQQYFSSIAMALVFLLAALAAATFALAYSGYFDRFKSGMRVLALLVFASIIVAYYSLTFNLIAPNVLASAGNAAFLVVFATIISIASIYMIGRMVKGRSTKTMNIMDFAKVLAALVIASALAYGAMYGLSTTNWGGVDELAYNYYASYLFLHAQNPYTQSMQYILNSRNIFPTVLLNGTYEYTYDYPALSFLAYVPITALGITSLYSFVAVLIFLCVLASFAVYYRSGFNDQVLIPLAVWLVLGFSLASVSNTFLAVSVFLLFAYVFKDRPLVSGLLMGLGASTSQLAWFAIPFFYVLALRQHGGSHMLKQAGVSIAAFFLVNAYFIALSPVTTIGNMFGLFGSTKLPFYGPNIMQLFVAFYSMPYSYNELMSALMLLWALAMLYLYTKTAKPLLALVPMFIFFLSWRNISIYAIPFVPLVLLMCYHKDGHDNDKDMLKAKMPMIFSAFALVIIAAGAMVYLHNSYAGSNTLHLNSVIPIIYVNASPYYPYSLGGLKVNITNNGLQNETVSFLTVSRSPNNEGYVLGSAIGALPAKSTSNYTLNYQLPLINNSTKLFVVAFSKDYITSKELNIAIRHP